MLDTIKTTEEICMDMSGNIQKALLTVLAVVGIIGMLAIAPYIYTLIVGVLFDAGSDSGILTENSETYNLTQDIERNFTSNMGKVNSAAGIGLNLLIVAVVLIVFAGIVYLGFKGAKKMKGGNTGGY